MNDSYLYSCIGFSKEVNADGRYIPKRSQKIKNKRLRAKKKRRKGRRRQ